MTARGVCVLALFVLAGCGWLHRDLISRGVYRLETVGVLGCEVAATAVERAGKLHLDGLIRGIRLTSPVTGEVEVRLKTPDGKEAGWGRGAIRPVGHRRTGHSHPRFEVTFDELPPPGTVIMVFPRFPLCATAAPAATSGNAEAK